LQIFLFQFSTFDQLIKNQLSTFNSFQDIYICIVLLQNHTYW